MYSCYKHIKNNCYANKVPRGGFRGGRVARPPKIRKAYVIQR
jgi:hypothetical protein